jgi:periplasmic divalent cation tolerance protein
MNARLVISTFPDAATARQIGTQLVELQLATCVNLFPGEVESIYRWKGKIETGKEVVALIKTTKYKELEEKLAKLHPYEVPEIIAIEITTGLPAYLNWLQGK